MYRRAACVVNFTFRRTFCLACRPEYRSLTLRLCSARDMAIGLGHRGVRGGLDEPGSVAQEIDKALEWRYFYISGPLDFAGPPSYIGADAELKARQTRGRRATYGNPGRNY